MRKGFEEFARAVEHPGAVLASSKAQSGRPVIGCFPMYVPHEMVQAAGMMAVDLYGAGGEMTAAASYLQPITCYPVRGAMETLLTGRLSGLDGMIFASVCTGAFAAGEMWRTTNPLAFYHQFVLSHFLASAEARSYLRYQFELLQSALETFAGRAITDAALSDAIVLYNRGRSLLERLHRLGTRNPEALPPQDLAVVRAAGAFMPRVEYVDLLSTLLAGLEAAPAALASERVPLVLVGSLCDLPQFPILSLIHEAGGIVMEDDSPLGRRNWLPVSEAADPIDALVQHYVDAAPCPTKLDGALDANHDYLLGLVRSSHAAGIVFLRPLYCDPAGLDYAMLSRRLNAADVPTLALDLNGREPATGQVETRLQAFIEMLRG